MYLSKNGNTSLAPGVFLQSRIRSHTIANKEYICTPALAICAFAVSRTRGVVVPLASMLAKTEYPAARRDRERKAVQTSVVMPARMIWVLLVASMAARNEGLSQALVKC
jgi:hypothetical protein